MTKKAGRPRTINGERSIGIRIPEVLLEAVDAWGAANGTGRSGAIRELLAAGLAAKEKQPAASKPARTIPPKAKPVRKTAPPKRRT